MPSNMTAADLLAVPDDEFKAVVEADMRHGLDADTAKALRSAEVVDRWFHALLSMQKSVEGQLAAKEAEFEQTRANSLQQGAGGKKNFLKRQEAYQRWRAGSIRFKVGVEQALIEARRHRAGSQRYFLEMAVAEENDRLLQRVRDLEKAIRAHREDFSDEDEPDDADVTLWRMLGDD